MSNKLRDVYSNIKIKDIIDVESVCNSTGMVWTETVSDVNTHPDWTKMQENDYRTPKTRNFCAHVFSDKVPEDESDRFDGARYKGCHHRSRPVLRQLSAAVRKNACHCKILSLYQIQTP